MDAKAPVLLAILLALVFLAMALACGNGQTAVPSTPKSTPAPDFNPPTSGTAVAGEIPGVRVGRTMFPVKLAVTQEERYQGLSGTPFLEDGTGMLFVFEEAQRPTFWMKDMHYPLDILWIGAGCRLVDISRDVPPPEPGTSDRDLARASPSQAAKYVLEINGSESAQLGLAVGDPVTFSGSIAGEYGC